MLFPKGRHDLFKSAVKGWMEQRLQLKLKGNTSANLYFSGTEFQSVFVGRENA